MRDRVLAAIMRGVESAVRTQMQSEKWRTRLAASSTVHHHGIGVDTLEIDAGTLEILAHEIAADVAGGLSDTCGWCGSVGRAPAPMVKYPEGTPYKSKGNCPLCMRPTVDGIPL